MGNEQVVGTSLRQAGTTGWNLATAPISRFVDSRRPYSRGAAGPTTSDLADHPAFAEVLGERLDSDLEVFSHRRSGCIAVAGL